MLSKIILTRLIYKITAKYTKGYAQMCNMF